jgi:PAS domain S-box-containing protein
MHARKQLGRAGSGCFCAAAEGQGQPNNEEQREIDMNRLSRGIEDARRRLAAFGLSARRASMRQSALAQAAEGLPLALDGMNAVANAGPPPADPRLTPEASHRLAAIVESSDDAIIGKDLDGIITSWNRAAERLYGYSEQEVLGKPISIIIPDDRSNEFSQIMEKVRRGERVDHLETVRKRKDGVLIEVSVTVSPIRDDAGRIVGCSAIGHDITERRRAEAERERLNAELREARKMEAIGRFAGGIAHDFNNLMSAVLGCASYLRRKRAPDGSDDEALAQIEKAAAAAGRLAHELLVYAGGGRIHPRLVKVAEVVDRAVEIFKPSLPANVDLEGHLAGDLGEAQCDTTRMEQVLVNLCRNACDAMPTGGHLTITAENVRLDSPLRDAHPPLPAGDYVCIMVEDTGCGIVPETLKSIFEPFFTTKPNGYGLGLAASSAVVRSHHGAISVETSVGVGTTFRVWLPRAGAAGETPVPARNVESTPHGQ